MIERITVIIGVERYDLKPGEIIDLFKSGLIKWFEPEEARIVKMVGEYLIKRDKKNDTP